MERDKHRFTIYGWALLIVQLCLSHIADASISRKANLDHNAGSQFERAVSSAHSLPKNFYSGELEKGSNCYLAYTKMAQLCGMASERERSWLATLLTNCHLEGSGRETILWHPEYALRDASPHEYSLVNRYIPLISDICDRTRNGHQLALFRIQVNHDRKLWDNIEELEETVRKANKVNLDSERLQEKFEMYAEDALSRSKEVHTLTGRLNDATTELELKHQELRGIHDKIQDSVNAFAEEKHELTSTMLSFAQEASEKMFSLGEQIQLKNSYNELLVNYTILKDNLRRRSESGSEPRFNAVRRVMLFPLESKLFQGLWLRVLRDMLWASLVAPFRLTKVLEILRRSEVLSGQAQNIIASLQAMISFLGVLVGYRAFLTMKGLIEDGSYLRDFLEGCYQLLMILIYPLKYLFQNRIVDQQIGYPQGLAISEQARDVQLRELMKIVNILLDEKIKSCVLHSVQDMQIDATLADKFKEFGETYENQISSKITRIERRQILIFRQLKEAQESISSAAVKDTGVVVRRSKRR